MPGTGGRHHLDPGQDPVGEHQRIDPEIVHGPATLGRVHGAAVIHQVLAHVHGDGLDPAQQIRREHLPDHVEARQGQRPHRLHAEQALVAGQLDQFPRGLDGGGHGFLDQHVPPGLQGEPGVGGVIQVARSDVDDVHVLGHEFLVGATGHLDAVSFGELACPFRGAGADGDNALGGVPGHRGDEPVGDPSGSDHAPAKGGHGGRVGGAGLGQGVNHLRSVPGSNAQIVRTYSPVILSPVCFGAVAAPGGNASGIRPQHPPGRAIVRRRAHSRRFPSLTGTSRRRGANPSPT